MRVLKLHREQGLEGILSDTNVKRKQASSDVPALRSKQSRLETTAAPVGWKRQGAVTADRGVKLAKELKLKVGLWLEEG